MNSSSVPLRATPPRAETVMEQWVIDSLLHLDECIDRVGRQSADHFKSLHDAQQELRAEVTASITALHSGDSTLEGRFSEHENKHAEDARVEKAEHGVWSSQLRWGREIVRSAFEVGKIAGGVGFLKLIGIL